MAPLDFEPWYDPEHVPAPAIVLMGCRAWPPGPARQSACPVCGRGVHVGHDSTYCAVCDSVSPRRESQIRAIRLGIVTRGLFDQGERDALAQLLKATRKRGRAVKLTEQQRRRLWTGCAQSILGNSHPVPNRARIGRLFLKSIHQCPDWRLRLSPDGKVVGIHAA